MLASRSDRASASAVTTQSRLMGEALERVLAETAAPITVLDLGPGHPATADFFAELAAERRVSLLFCDSEDLFLWCCGSYSGIVRVRVVRGFAFYH